MATNIDKIARQLEGLRRQAYGDYITIAGVKLRYLEMGSGSPVMLIHGAHDRVFPLDDVINTYHNMPNSRLIIIPNCGHSPHIEKPAEFNDAVVRFLEATEAVA
jgi:pimeloyl-ACP methyl ester carboxylesterase